MKIWWLCETWNSRVHMWYIKHIQIDLPGGNVGENMPYFYGNFWCLQWCSFFDDATDAAGEKDSIKPKPLWRRQCIEKSDVKPRTQPRSIPKHMQLARTYLMYWIRQRNPKPLRTRNSMWCGSVFGDNAPDVAVLLLKGCHFWAKLRWTNGTF